MSKKLLNTEELKKLALKALEDLKGKDITSMDVTDHCDFTDVMIFCTGTSNRHVKSLAQNVVEVAKKNDQQPLGVEGEEEGDWVLIDLGDVIVHVMQQEVRDFYKVEELWDIKPDRSE